MQKLPARVGFDSNAGHRCDRDSSQAAFEERPRPNEPNENLSPASFFIQAAQTGAQCVGTNLLLLVARVHATFLTPARGAGGKEKHPPLGGSLESVSQGGWELTLLSLNGQGLGAWARPLFSGWGVAWRTACWCPSLHAKFQTGWRVRWFVRRLFELLAAKIPELLTVLDRDRPSSALLQMNPVLLPTCCQVAQPNPGRDPVFSAAYFCSRSCLRSKGAFRDIFPFVTGRMRERLF